jgi:hypothetical protein
MPTLNETMPAEWLKDMRNAHLVCAITGVRFCLHDIEEIVRGNHVNMPHTIGCLQKYVDAIKELYRDEIEGFEKTHPGMIARERQRYIEQMFVEIAANKTLGQIAAERGKSNP